MSGDNVSRVKARPRVDSPTEYGNDLSFWVEYPSGLIDLTRLTHAATDMEREPPFDSSEHLDITVDGGRVVRVARKRTALVIIDMQK